jgi:hypothetical protein
MCLKTVLTILTRARRDLDKYLFESKRQNFGFYYWKYRRSRGIREKNLQQSPRSPEIQL